MLTVLTTKAVNTIGFLALLIGSYLPGPSAALSTGVN